MADLITHSFPMVRGDSRSLTYVVKDQQTLPVVVDITTATFIWILIEQDVTAALASDPQPAEGGTPIETKTESTGVSIDDGPAGEVSVTLNSADTTGQLAPADYYHELQMTLGGKVSTLVRGIISLERDNIAPGP